MMDGEKSLSMDKKGKGTVRSTRQLSEESTSLNSVESIIKAIQNHYQKSGKASNTNTDDNNSADKSVLGGSTTTTTLRRQQNHQRQQQQQPGAVNIRGIDHNESDDDEQKKYDNLNEIYSEEFRHTGIVQARVVSQRALEREVLGRIQQTDACIIQEERQTNISKTLKAKLLKHIGIFVWIVIIIALVGGFAGGILSSRRNDSETPSPSSLLSPLSQPPLPIPSLFPTASPTPYVPEELLELFSIVQIQPNYPFPHDTSSYSYKALEWIQGQRNKYPNITQQEIVYKYVGACMVFVGDALEIYSAEVLAATGWLTDRPVCEWLGIVCGYEEMPMIHSTTATNFNENQVVVGIVQNVPQIEGVIPPELALLSNSLRELTFTGTQIYGTIPTELGLLMKLQTLDLSSNDLTGKLPSEIGLLTQLRYLNVADNSLTGTFPREISSIGSSLEEIDLSDNRLSGDLDSNPFIGLTNLQVFRGDSNPFGGSLMSEVGLLTKLRVLSTFETNMESSLPTEIGLLTNLEELNAGLNLHVGSLPSEMGLLTSLQRLYLDRNVFTGTIPPNMFDELANLTVLDVSLNELSGALPGSLGLLPRLIELYVGGNKFVGSNPVCENEASSQDGVIILADCLELDCSCCSHCCEGIPFCHREQIVDP